MENAIKNLIENDVNKQLKFHNGSCSLVEVKDDVAYIKLEGNCTGCPGRRHTFLNGIKPYLLENVEGLKGVELVK